MRIRACGSNWIVGLGWLYPNQPTCFGGIDIIKIEIGTFSSSSAWWSTTSKSPLLSSSPRPPIPPSSMYSVLLTQDNSLCGCQLDYLGFDHHPYFYCPSTYRLLLPRCPDNQPSHPVLSLCRVGAMAEFVWVGQFVRLLDCQELLCCFSQAPLLPNLVRSLLDWFPNLGQAGTAEVEICHV